MMKYILFPFLLFGVVSGLFAQETVNLSLKPDTPEKKEIRISQANSDGINDFKLFMNVEWKIVDGKDRIILTFDRTSSEGDGLILAFPLMKKPMSLKNAKACNSTSKRIWKGKGAKSIKEMSYFLQSDDIEKEYKDCYRFVAINNKEDFDFKIVQDKENLFISLTNLFVMREEKRPKYYLSKRDMKLEYRAQPIDIKITLNRVPASPCDLESNAILLKDLNEKIIELEAIQENASEAVKSGKNCYTQLKEIQSNLKANYPQKNSKWDNTDCDQVQEGYLKYKQLVSQITSLRCKSSSTEDTSICSQLKRINRRLMNLQMQIYAKKKQGKSIDKEKEEYLSIKNDTDKKISPECNKDLLGSYKSFCTYIEEALNK